MLGLQELFDADRTLTPEDWQAIRDHPVRGAEALPDDFSPAARMIVRTHHENLDGSGYPEGLSADKLHVFTRVVRIADAYDASTSSRAYREAQSPARTLWEMSTGPYRRFYDQTLMRTFVQMMQPFPIGSKIRLRNGFYGVVVKYNRKDPLSPMVIIAFDTHNRRLPNSQLLKPIILGERPEFRASSFCGEDLMYLYEPDQTELNRSRVGIWPSLFQAAYP
jgi:hypothetical protein